MTEKIPTVDEIMAMVRECVFRVQSGDTSNANYMANLLRAAITTLHTAATRKPETGIMSAEDERHERAVSP